MKDVTVIVGIAAAMTIMAIAAAVAYLVIDHESKKGASK